MRDTNAEASTHDVSVDALSRQAGEQQAAGHFEEALNLYDQALALNNERADDWVNRGLAQWSLQRHEAALASYDQALEIEPHHALAWMNRGNVLHDLGRPQTEVLENYDRALEIDPHLATAWYNKGDSLGRQGRFIEARACFENALELGIPEAAGMVRRCEDILMNESYS